MSWIDQGGLMTWPLLALSVTVLAVFFDRAIVFSTLRLPDAKMENALLAALEVKDKKVAYSMVKDDFPFILPLVEALAADQSATVRECDAAICIEEAIRSLDRRVEWLALASRVAPLMGLLGTIVGIIVTFSHMSEARGGVDMSSLAEGIWQALIATAIGLCIAIPSVLAHHGFHRREESVAFALNRLANRALVRGKKE